MKKEYLFLLSVCLFPSSEIYTQDLFTVIKVSGNIIIERTGSSLGTGTHLPRVKIYCSKSLNRGLQLLIRREGDSL